MLRGAVRGAIVLWVVSSVAACALLTTKREPVTDEDARYAAVSSPVPSPTPYSALWDGSEYAIIVRKHERTLTLYRRSVPERVYPIVLGIDPNGPKVYQGDLRTPEGLYRIQNKRPHERWARFLLLSYPNDVDRQRYAMAMNEGRVPIVDGHAPGLGGAVGIHGTDREDSNTRGVDWTWGCISMLNQHVAEIYDRVPIGTPVLIEQ